ncbi:MAG: SMP-30/gluconolactonase/LRE family protein [Pseudomonadota bacterium]|nr:SMP-30/gluconolactonase/LRE family protein [Pseudomonadota bacterium]
MNLELSHVAAIGAELGEGPVWEPHQEALWFVDILGERVHRYQPATRAHRAWPAPAKVSFIVPMHGGGFLVGLKTGLSRFDPDSGEFRHVAAVEPHLPGNRLNDACVDSEGELWFGSMDDLETEPTGCLYSLGRDGRAMVRDSGYVVTNGPAFSPCGRFFYHTDSANRVIFRFDRGASGALSGKRIFVRIEPDAGYPDGTTIDSEGCLWVALWRGWAVRRYSPDGELLQSIRFPCANVTKIAFAGEGLRTAYATTACCGLSDADRAAQPRAGNLFSFQSPAAGLPAHLFVLNTPHP